MELLEKVKANLILQHKSVYKYYLAVNLIEKIKEEKAGIN
jgi:hypothetical protein